jgi:hypothetical protein
VERRIDSVLQAEAPEAPGGAYLLLAESQTDPDPDKAYTWPHNYAYLRDAYRQEVELAVVTSKPATARWARDLIHCGLPGAVCMTVRAFTFGPDEVSAVTALTDAAADPWYAVFAALVHSRSRQCDGILEVLAEALDTMNVAIAARAAGYVEAGLGSTAGREKWRKLMATQTYGYITSYISEQQAIGIEQGREKGREEGLATAILRVLERRGIAVTDADHDRITACTDTSMLGTWLDRSLTASKASDLFT